MGQQLTVWHGTAAECQELMLALQHAGTTPQQVGEVLGDQRVIDRLLFVRRTGDRWWRSEWTRGDDQEASSS